MAKLRAVLTGVAGCALVLTAVTPAAAAGGGAGAAGTPLVTVGPSAIAVAPAFGRPGGNIDLRTFADCGGAETGTVASAAFAAPVGLGLAADGGLFAQAQVGRNTRPGAYTVLELCGGRKVAAGTLQVVAPLAPDTGGGWGALSRTAPVATAFDGTRGGAALGLTGAAALCGLLLLGRRTLGSPRNPAPSNPAPSNRPLRNPSPRNPSLRNPGRG